MTPATETAGASDAATGTGMGGTGFFAAIVFVGFLAALRAAGFVPAAFFFAEAFTPAFAPDARLAAVFVRSLAALAPGPGRFAEPAARPDVFFLAGFAGLDVLLRADWRTRAPPAFFPARLADFLADALFFAAMDHSPAGMILSARSCGFHCSAARTRVARSLYSAAESSRMPLSHCTTPVSGSTLTSMNRSTSRQALKSTISSRSPR